MKNYTNSEQKQALRKKVFTEPITKEVKRYLIDYIQIFITEAQALPHDRLLGSEGHELAMSICGALAFQEADGVDYDGWFNERDEPILTEILNISGILDADANHTDEWQRLFELSERL